MSNSTVPQNPVDASQTSGSGQATTVQTAAAQPAVATQPTPAPVIVTPPSYFASIHPGPQHPLPVAFVDAVKTLEGTLGMPLWLYIQDQNGEARFDEVNEDVMKAFWAAARSQMQANQPIALLIDSPGGYSKSAYQTATLLRHRCGEFTAIIPRYAKSAATLLALGASVIILNTDAELGPLDVQIFILTGRSGPRLLMRFKRLRGFKRPLYP